MVIAALRAGKQVFVEKPLCIRPEELAEIGRTVTELGEQCPLLMVGFNRRFAPATAALRGHFADAGPLSVSYRFAPGAIPPEHWTQDEDVGGGRIVGEACHAIDTCVALTGSLPVRVHAESVARAGGLETTDDRVFITLRHENGSISSLSYQAGGIGASPPSGSRCSAAAGRPCSTHGTGWSSGAGGEPRARAPDGTRGTAQSWRPSSRPAGAEGRLRSPGLMSTGWLRPRSRRSAACAKACPRIAGPAPSANLRRSEHPARVRHRRHLPLR
ncbi:MAG: Gfo/Idh/MocA family oxidoreductase [Anaeromyxobacter sp.]